MKGGVEETFRSPQDVVWQNNIFKGGCSHEETINHNSKYLMCVLISYM